MKSRLEIHPLQAAILCDLLIVREVRFAKLNCQNVPTDQFTFHLKSLIAEKLITKSTSGLYQLTAKGKEFANRFDTQKVSFEKQAKVSVLLVCKQGAKYLIQQRLKEPYYGYHGFLGGKITIGETVQEAAIREFREETGLKAIKLSLQVVKHKMDYSPDGTLLEDKFFFIFLVTKFSGKLIEIYAGGKNMWLTRQEISHLPKMFDGVLDTLDSALQNKLKFYENKYSVTGF